MEGKLTEHSQEQLLDDKFLYLNKLIYHILIVTPKCTCIYIFLEIVMGKR